MPGYNVMMYSFGLDRNGPLKPGYGSSQKKIGPELGFGWVVGDAFEEPVLLIKLAWGGKSLAEDFRPPSLEGDTGPLTTSKLLRRRKKFSTQLTNFFPN